MQRLERVVNLLAALIETERPLTRDEIQQRVPGYEGEPASARRSFERDKQMLRDMGLPLVIEVLDPDHPEDGTGYRIPKDDYQLRDPELTREETAALGIAASAVRLKSQSAAAALLKLGGAPNIDSTTDVDLAGEETLTAFFTARRERRTVTFNYSGRERTLDPHNLTFRNGRWYVRGFDHERNEARTYRLDRVNGALETSEANAFEQPPTAAQRFPSPWEIGEGDPTDVHVLVDADQADLAVAQTSEELVKVRNDDGSIVLMLKTVNFDAMRSFVLGFLDHAEILEPQNVRKDFVDYVRAMAHR